MGKRVYVSLPISGRRKEDAAAHANHVKAALSRAGYTVVTPFDIVHEKGAEYADFIGADITVMLKQDIVIFCRGWEDSFGCQMERAVAEIWNKKMASEKKPPILLVCED